MDEELRRTERQGDRVGVFVRRYRARLAMPLYLPRGERCHNPVLEDAPALGVVELAAYAGSEVALGLLDREPDYPAVTVSEYLMCLWAFTGLGDVGVGAECKVSMTRYVSVLAGWAAGAAALDAWEADNGNRYHVPACPWARTSPLGHADSYVLGEPFCICQGDNRDPRPQRALEATQAWLVCPCPRRRAPCMTLAASLPSFALYPGWSVDGAEWSNMIQSGLNHSVQLTSFPRVRIAIQRVLLALVGL